MMHTKGIAVTYPLQTLDIITGTCITQQHFILLIQPPTIGIHIIVGIAHSKIGQGILTGGIGIAITVRLLDAGSIGIFFFEAAYPSVTGGETGTPSRRCRERMFVARMKDQVGSL
jgi:hypothetical protein